MCLFLRLFVIFAFCHEFLNGLNNSTQNTDCFCSDQMGAVCTCSCQTSPNTREGWFCNSDSNGDCVRNKNFLRDSFFKVVFGK